MHFRWLVDLLIPLECGSKFVSEDSDQLMGGRYWSNGSKAWKNCDSIA